MSNFGRVFIVFIAMLTWVALPTLCEADLGPATQPATPVKTGEFQGSFTFRDPLSARSQIAGRLKLSEKEMGDDYVLSERPFWIYVPANYDPGTAYGIVVYLGYKDSPSTPPLWQAVADKAHLIFITPVCHGGAQYPPSVPQWQMVGLALDAVQNLKRQYNIDSSRIYQMSWNSGSMQAALATADVFTGFIITFDHTWCEPLTLSDGRSYKPTFAHPAYSLFSQARHRAFYIIEEEPSGADQPPALRERVMKREGFTHIKDAQLSLRDDLHYPLFKAEWFEQDALPFLDAAAAEAKPAQPADHGGG